MFHVIAVDTGLPVVRPDGEPMLFQTGQDAAAEARALSTATGKKHQPRPVLDVSWRAREAKRLDDGTYTPLPWDALRIDSYYGMYPDECDYKRTIHWFYKGEGTEHHYAHVSSKVPGNIAFTETDEKGARDIQTTMKPGRYLQRFYGAQISLEMIRTFANEFIAQYGDVALKWAHTADDFERVYTSGPRSCMSHPVANFSSPIHPVRVYAAGDLVLAYLANKDEDGEEHITARAVCWPKHKIFSRIYGDEDKLSNLLRAEGYHDGSLDGARMLRVEHRGALVVPYVDGSNNAREEGAYLVIDDCGEINCEVTTGLTRCAPPCPRCGDGMDEDTDCYVSGIEETWCQSCGENHAFYCEQTSEYWPEDEAVTMASGETWSQEYFETHGAVCDATGERYPAYEMVETSDGEMWSQDYFDNHRPADLPHVPRQGRDEHPDQIEMVLHVVVPPVVREWRHIKVGDWVVTRYDGPNSLVPPGTYRVESVDPDDTELPLRLYVDGALLWAYARTIIGRTLGMLEVA